jgi:hypothetical protein
LQDLAVANYGSIGVSVLLGNGDGTFRTARNYGPTSFNADGRQDLAVANDGSNNVSVLINNTRP